LEHGNFINRTLAFIHKYYDAIVPDGQLTTQIGAKLLEQFHAVGDLIESGNLKEAIEIIFEFVRFGNKYFDSEQPWITRSTDVKTCANTIYNCVQIIANLAVLLEPFLPFSSQKVKQWLAIEDGWLAKTVPAGFVIPEPQILFERLERL